MDGSGILANEVTTSRQSLLTVFQDEKSVTFLACMNNNTLSQHRELMPYLYRVVDMRSKFTARNWTRKYCLFGWRATPAETWPKPDLLYHPVTGPEPGLILFVASALSAVEYTAFIAMITLCLAQPNSSFTAPCALSFVFHSNEWMSQKQASARFRLR